MNNSFKAEFPSLPCNESFARMIAAGFVMELDPTCSEVAEIKTAISEAVTNAIIHGYGHNEGIVYIEGKCHGREITFIITDRGKGINDIGLARTPLYTGDKDSERSGMGFTIMEAFMDKVEVDSCEGQGTKITLTKNLIKDVTTDDK